MTKIAIRRQLPLRADCGPASVFKLEFRLCLAAFGSLFNIKSLGGNAFASNENPERTSVHHVGRVRSALLFFRGCRRDITSEDHEKNESKGFRIAHHWFSFVWSSRWESTSSDTWATVLPDVSIRGATAEYWGTRER